MTLHNPRKKPRIHFDDDDTPRRPHTVNSSPLQKQREQLPIAKGQYFFFVPFVIPITRGTHVLAGREALIREIRENDVTILLGETGSGKTTRTY